MLTFPILTPHLIERLEQAALHKGYDALRRASALPGNPYDVAVYDRHGLLAYRVGGLPRMPWYNTVTGLGEVNLAHLDAALTLYRDQNITPNLTIWATRLSPALGVALFDHGFTPRGVTVTLCAVPRPPAVTTSPGVTVRELLPHEEPDTFNAVLLAGYGFTDPVQQALAVLENEGVGVRRYLALVEGQPAAVAAMTERDGLAYLAGAATLPGMRGRGAQTALIQARLADAAHSSELVVVTTGFATRSQHNLERNGFRIAHQKTSWVPRHCFG